MNRVGIQDENDGLAKLVTDVATSLMTVRASTLNETCELVLQQLVAYFDVDMTFVRQNDHDLGATVLLAEWPARSEVPDPDPLGVVFFDGADPIFAALESLSEVLIARPGDVDPGYQDRVRDGSGIIGGVSTVTIPMMRRGVTTGSLGLIQFGDRGWSPAEINSLTALAALLDQALSRVEAEARLRYLAYHDELTELYNRRALFDHLDARLTSTHPGPVAIMLIDLDRLKAVNDFLGHAAGDSFLQSIAVRLSELCDTDDFAARLGGDEFVVVLRRPTDQAGLLEAAQRLQAVLTVPTKVGSDDMSRTVSIGLGGR